MSVTTQHVFWRAPSGFIHSMATCSGGPGAHRMTKVMLNPDQFRTAAKCKCARWSAVERGEVR